MRTHVEDGGSIPAWAGETICALVRPWEKTVYPRVGGGNDKKRLIVGNRVGLSPRGRGKPEGR